MQVERKDDNTSTETVANAPDQGKGDVVGSASGVYGGCLKGA